MKYYFLTADDKVTMASIPSQVQKVVPPLASGAPAVKSKDDSKKLPQKSVDDKDVHLSNEIWSGLSRSFSPSSNRELLMGRSSNQLASPSSVRNETE